MAIVAWDCIGGGSDGGDDNACVAMMGLGLPITSWLVAVELVSATTRCASYTDAPNTGRRACSVGATDDVLASCAVWLAVLLRTELLRLILPVSALAGLMDFILYGVVAYRDGERGSMLSRRRARRTA